MLDRYWPILPNMFVMRRSAFESAGSFWEEPGIYRACADTYLMMRLREVGHFRYVSEPLLTRRHPSYRVRMKRYSDGHTVLRRLMKEPYGEYGRWNFELDFVGRAARMFCVAANLDLERIRLLRRARFNALGPMFAKKRS